MEPPAHRFPPASLGDAPVVVSVVQLQLTFAIDFPWSGTLEGSGTATPAPPKYNPPQASVKKFGAPSASRWPHVPEPPAVVVNESIDGAPPEHVQAPPGGHGGRVVVVVPGGGHA